MTDDAAHFRTADDLVELFDLERLDADLFRDKPGVPRGGPSLDHAVWFHHPAKADDWMLLWMWPLKAGGSRGLYTGTMHDRSGRLMAVINQEILFRWRPPGPPIASPGTQATGSPRS